MPTYVISGIKLRREIVSSFRKNGKENGPSIIVRKVGNVHE